MPIDIVVMQLLKVQLSFPIGLKSTSQEAPHSSFRKTEQNSMARKDLGLFEESVVGLDGNDVPIKLSSEHLC